MKIYKLNILMAVLLLIAGCSDSFLEVKPKNDLQQADFYETPVQMYEALMATYDALGYDYGMAAVVPLGEIRSDNCKTGGGGEGDQPDMQALEDFTNTEVNSICYDYWRRNYIGIYRANLVLEAELDDDDVKVYKAEARFLRAWYYFDLLRTFGPVPLVLSSYTPIEEKQTRATREAIYTQIEDDLIKAIPLLLEVHAESEVGRITKAAAQALLAKHYIYQADWNNDDVATFKKAIAPLQAIIDDGNYALISDYRKIYEPLNENNSEGIFELQRSDQSLWTSWGNTNGGEGNFWCQFSGLRGLSWNHPDIQPGWGFTLPQQDLYDYYLPDDTLRRQATIYTEEEVLSINTPDTEPGDSVSWNIGSYNQFDFVGYAQKKFPLSNAYSYPGGSRALNRPLNERIIRYGEVYLLLAEAHLRGGGSEATAKDLINKLRQEHVYMGSATFDGVDELLSKYPERFSTTLDVLWYERRVELAGEGDRWFDLVRSGRAKEVMGAIYPEDFDDHDIYLPISSLEIGASGGSLEAYPVE